MHEAPQYDPTQAPGAVGEFYEQQRAGAAAPQTVEQPQPEQHGQPEPTHAPEFVEPERPQDAGDYAYKATQAPGETGAFYREQTGVTRHADPADPFKGLPVTTAPQHEAPAAQAPTPAARGRRFGGFTFGLLRRK